MTREDYEADLATTARNLFLTNQEEDAIAGLEQVINRYAEVLGAHNEEHAKTIRGYASDMISDLRFTVAQDRERARRELGEGGANVD